MHIIPVLDLMGGQVVQGSQGDRARYQPVKSVLTTSSEPFPLALVLQTVTGGESLYIADLDAIEGKGDHRSTIEVLAERLSIDLWVDAGAADADAVQHWLDAGVARVVVGSETLTSVESLDSIQARHSPQRLVFSLDVGRGTLLSHCAQIRELSPLMLLERLSAGGWTHVILLTLDRVGSGGGPDWTLLESARRAWPDLSLFAGGGVRTIDDLHRLSQLGMSGVLLATALHRGWVTRHDLLALTSGPGA